MLLREHESRVSEGLVQGGTLRSIVTVDEAQFQTLLDQVRELHQLADELTHSSTMIHANVRARLSWNQPPVLPPEQTKLADEAVEMLGLPRLSPSQARQLQRIFFGK